MAARFIVMRLLGLAGLSVLVVILFGCADSDPRTEILEQRARWTVQPLEWVLADDGTVTLSTRISGPVHSQIERLTFRVVLTGPGGVSRDVWRTVDLTTIPRGGPIDVPFHIDAGSDPVDDLRLDPVPDPTGEEQRHIVEMRDLAAAS